MCDEQYYSERDITGLYEELKDINIEDYLDETGTYLIGAVTGPIPKTIYDMTCKVAHLFRKDMFHLFPGQNHLMFTNRYDTEFLGIFIIFENEVMSLIVNKNLYTRPKFSKRH